MDTLKKEGRNNGHPVDGALWWMDAGVLGGYE